MKADQEKNTDKIIKNIIREAGIDKAPQGFTNSVMQAIRSVQEVDVATTYRPLLSKNAWVLLGLTVIGLCVFMLTTDQQAISFGHYLPFSEYVSDLGLGRLIDNMSLNTMSNINIDSSVIYAMLMLPIFFLFQIYFLQRKQV